MKNKYIIKSLIIILLMISMIVIKPSKIDATSNISVMKSSSGSDLTYRNSNEKVYGLTEYDYPTAEYRAAWVSVFVGDMPSYTTESSFKANTKTLLDDLVSMGMNAVVFHVRTHNNALYNSDLNPKASWWANVNFEVFDPLTYFIDECHKRGIEFHAWMNPYRVYNGSSHETYQAESYPANHPCNNPSLMLTYGDSRILDPGSTVVQDFIVDTCMEFLDRYDADAIHFDDYFYIDKVATNLSSDQKRANVNSFIKKLSDAMKEMNTKEGRAVQLGISPSGIYRNGNYSQSPTYNADGSLKSPIASNTSGFAHYDNYLYSDTKYWIDQHWIDYITPQAYWGMEHTNNNFFELTRWWSWCVRYSKTNLYMGIGIYMASGTGTSPSYWQKNNNEVKNQLLNAGMYDEIKGTCFYKYSSLKETNNTIIANGVNLIKNDYWTKRIPGAVIPRYAESIPSVEVSNLALSSNTLSWDAIEKVFGYMVYQVPKGDTLDINNIDHVLTYTQSNSVNNIDTANYDYYVSSVNRANVKSNPVRFGQAVQNMVEIVINSINSLPNEITLDQEDLVTTIRNRYDSLTNDEKNQITNYATLQNAETMIAKLISLKNKAETFVSTISKNIYENRILPTTSNISWSYKNVNDATKYNISTGERLINYLVDVYITLYLNITENNVTYQHPVEFNLGLLKEGQVGLIYRNDASALSEDHIGQYTNTSSFIGWAKETVTVGNYVLFIAANNFFRLDGSEIPSCNWTSCAGVYENISKNNITMTLGDAFSTQVTGYGYFVIGSNKTVKYVTDSSLSSETITLLPGEALVIMRYLDRLTGSAPLNPATQVSIGTSAYLTSYNDIAITPAQEGEAVKSAIALLPTDITLDDEEQINNIITLYNALSEEAKAYVTNYNILEQATKKIEELKLAFNQYKTDKKNYVQNYPVMNDYSISNQTIITNYINQAKTDIDNAMNKNTIDNIVTNCINKIDNVLTLEKEFEAYKTEQINLLDQSIDLEAYSQKNQLLITGYLEEAHTSINNATTTIEVDQAVFACQGKVNQLSTKAQELTIYRKNINEEIDNYVKLSDYSEANQTIIAQYMNDASNALTTATTEEKMDEIFATFKENVNEIKTLSEELLSYKDQKKQELKDYVNNLNLTEELLQKVNKILNTYIDSIYEENTVSRINYQANLCIAQINKTIIVTYAENQVAIKKAEIDLTKYSINNQTIINNLFNEVIILANQESTSTKDIDDKLTEVLEIILTIKTLEQDLASNKNQGISDINNLFNELVLNSYEKTYVEDIKDGYLEEVNNATTTEQVETKVIDFTNFINNIVKPLLAAKKEVSTYINDLSANGLDATKVEKIQKLINDKKAELEKCIALNDVNTIKNTTKQAYDLIINEKETNKCNSCNSVEALFTFISTISLLVLIIRKHQ